MRGSRSVEADRRSRQYICVAHSCSKRTKSTTATAASSSSVTSVRDRGTRLDDDVKLCNTTTAIARFPPHSSQSAILATISARDGETRVHSQLFCVTIV